MQPNGCILVPASQIPKQNATTMVFAANPALKSRSLLQVKRPCPKVDDPVMASQNLCTKQARDRLRTSEEIAMNQAFEVDHADVFANNIHRADRESPNPGDFHAALLQVDGG